MEILAKFGDATGLQINMAKSSVLPIRCAELDLDNVLPDFTGQQGTFPLSYLGLPLTLGRIKLVHLQPILDKTKTRMSGWQGKLLTSGGRRELVRSVLSSMPIYLLTALKVPKQFTKEFDKARRSFLWAGSQGLHGGKCKVNWPRTCLPTSKGGLGIIDLDRFSRALRLRWLWYTWTSPDKPWVGSELPVDDTDRALFAAATRVSVRNGKLASFWKSSWLNGQTPRQLFPHLYKHSKRKNRTVAAALNDDKWVLDICYNLDFDLLTDFFNLWNLIVEENANLFSLEEDQITWTRTTSGIYYAKSAYDIQLDGIIDSACAPLTWKPWAPSKCKFFIWLLLQNRIWTADRLLQRGWPNEYFCPLCVRNLETVNHLITECPYSRALWTKVASWSTWFLGLSEGAVANSPGLYSMTMLVVWMIWRERNNRIFRGESNTVQRLWIMAGAKALGSLVGE